MRGSLNPSLASKGCGDRAAFFQFRVGSADSFEDNSVYRFYSSPCLHEILLEDNLVLNDTENNV